MPLLKACNLSASPTVWSPALYEADSSLQQDHSHSAHYSTVSEEKKQDIFPGNFNTFAYNFFPICLPWDQIRIQIQESI